jgi:hypothetical protein
VPVRKGRGDIIEHQVGCGRKPEEQELTKKSADKLNCVRSVRCHYRRPDLLKLCHSDSEKILRSPKFGHKAKGLLYKVSNEIRG